MKKKLPGWRANEVHLPTPVTYPRRVSLATREMERNSQSQEDKNEQDMWAIVKRLIHGNWKIHIRYHWEYQAHLVS